jgi:hypothetical protein
MNDGSRQHRSGHIGGIGLNHRNTVLAGRNHRSTSCDCRSHKKRIRKERPSWRPALDESLVTVYTLRLLSEIDDLFA